MLISIIIPTYNREKTILRAIDSVLNGSYQNIELIIIDDGSTDTTKEVLSYYIENKLINYFYIENSGVSKARNIGVDIARGEWIAFLDSDDEWIKHKLKLQIQFLKANPTYKVIHGEEIWFRNGKRINQKLKHKKSGGDLYIRSLELCLISPSTILLKKGLFLKEGQFREDFPVCEDYDLWLKISSSEKIGFITIPIINKYGGHKDQLSKKFFAMDYWRIKSMVWILKNKKLSTERYHLTRDIIIKKGIILIKGYLKYNNLKKMKEIESFLNTI